MVCGAELTILHLFSSACTAVGQNVIRRDQGDDLQARKERADSISNWYDCAVIFFQFSRDHLGDFNL